MWCKMINKKIKYILVLSLLITNYSLLFPQTVNQPLNNDVYQYLARLSQRGVIELNDEIRPLSRKYIAEKLVQLKMESDKLTPLELEELEFYAKDFGREISRIPQSRQDTKEFNKKKTDSLSHPDKSGQAFSFLSSHSANRDRLLLPEQTLIDATAYSAMMILFLLSIFLQFLAILMELMMVKNKHIFGMDLVFMVI